MSQAQTTEQLKPDRAPAADLVAELMKDHSFTASNSSDLVYTMLCDLDKQCRYKITIASDGYEASTKGHAENSRSDTLEKEKGSTENTNFELLIKQSCTITDEGEEYQAYIYILLKYILHHIYISKSPIV